MKTKFIKTSFPFRCRLSGCELSLYVQGETMVCLTSEACHVYPTPQLHTAESVLFSMCLVQIILVDALGYLNIHDCRTVGKLHKQIAFRSSLDLLKTRQYVIDIATHCRNCDVVQHIIFGGRVVVIGLYS